MGPIQSHEPIKGMQSLQLETDRTSEREGIRRSGSKHEKGVALPCRDCVLGLRETVREVKGRPQLIASKETGLIPTSTSD